MQIDGELNQNEISSQQMSQQFLKGKKCVVLLKKVLLSPSIYKTLLIICRALKYSIFWINVNLLY
jgi:hypothetical protein